MASGDYIDVPSLAQALLIGVVQYFADSSVELPDRQVIAPGEIRLAVHDCDSVIVGLGDIAVGSAPGQGAGARQTGLHVSVGVRYATLVIQIVRWVPEPDGNPPDAEKLTDAGLQLMRDAALLSQALAELCGRDGALRRAGSAVAGAVVTVGPEGGLAAVEGTVQVTAKALAS